VGEDLLHLYLIASKGIPDTSEIIAASFILMKKRALLPLINQQDVS
jgi:hypothetical protein